MTTSEQLSTPSGHCQGNNGRWQGIAHSWKLALKMNSVTWRPRRLQRCTVLCKRTKQARASWQHIMRRIYAQLGSDGSLKRPEPTSEPKFHTCSQTPYSIAPPRFNAVLPPKTKQQILCPWTGLLKPCWVLG